MNTFCFKIKWVLLVVLTAGPLTSHGQNHPDGQLKILFSKPLNGNIVLKETTFNGSQAVTTTVDSGSVVHGSYQLRYNQSDIRVVKAKFYPADSVKSIDLFVQNPFQNSFDDVFVLDNTHAELRIDSLFSIKKFSYYKGTITGSPESTMNLRLTNEYFNSKNPHRFTDARSGWINDFRIIKENSSSQILLKKIYEDRDYYSPDSLTLAFSLFSKNARQSSIGQKTNELIRKREQFAKTGIAKSFVFYDAQAKKYTLQECLNGKSYALLVFWASWCGPCKREIPRIKTLYNLFSDKIAFVSLSIDSDCGKWKKALAENPMEWLNLAGFPESGSKAMDVFNISWVPCFLVVNQSGRIVLNGTRAVTYQTKDGSRKNITIDNLEEYFTDLLKETDKQPKK